MPNWGEGREIEWPLPHLWVCQLVLYPLYSSVCVCVCGFTSLLHSCCQCHLYFPLLPKSFFSPPFYSCRLEGFLRKEKKRICTEMTQLCWLYSVFERESSAYANLHFCDYTKQFFRLYLTYDTFLSKKC